LLRDARSAAKASLARPRKLKIFEAPFIHTKDKLTLRVLGTHVTLLDGIRKRAEADLGFSIVFEAREGVAAQQKAVMRPQSFDVYDQWFNSIDLVWSSRSVQPIDAKRIRYWDEVNGLAKIGKLSPDAQVGLGDAPVRRLYVQSDGSLGAVATDQISMLPFVHNVDSFGYNAAFVPRGRPYETESWGWLFDERWKGKVALVNDPAIGVMDAALGAQACGLAHFRDIGNMSLSEIDALIGILIRRKRSGHFNSFWSNTWESESLMETDTAVIASMWSPAITALHGHGIPIVEAAPLEGYRAWHGGMCISQFADGRVLDAAYEYFNWWLSGWAGALMARQGYYISVPDRVRSYLLPEEWDYWYEGKPAVSDLPGPNGEIVVRRGERRNGGSYWQRVGNIAVWNSAMDEHNYLVRRWNELLSV
jgi:putative spermidine/putrescine transport system substrate-binding protein